MTTFQAASDHPLIKNWVTWITDNSWTWQAEALTLAGRAQWLALNDPFCAALVAAYIQGTLGPTGPRLSSLYDPHPHQPGTDPITRGIRRAINAVTTASWCSVDLDADGVRSRYDLEVALAWGSFVLGEMFAVRVLINGRSRWRLITPERVANPGSVANNADMRDGFRLENGRVVGIWVRLSALVTASASEYTYVPMIAADGTPNVIHRVGFRLPGMLRGITRLAPFIIMERQVCGVLESHVAAKRLQAIFGMIVEAQSPEEWEEAKDSGTALTPNLDVKGPLNIWVKPPDSKVDFTNVQFNGADLTDYLKICYKVECAVVQFPIDVVLCQMGEASLSSARAGLDQFDRTCQTEHSRHVAECSSKIDQAAIADALIVGTLDFTFTDPATLAVGSYSQPPKYSTDRLKDANTVKSLMESGVSQTTALRTVLGIDREDEQENKRAEAEFDAAQAAYATGPNDKIQSQSLAGPQIASLMEIVANVSTGALPIESAAALILAAFPTMSTETVDAILAPLKAKAATATATTPDPAAPAAPSATTPAPNASAHTSLWRRAVGAVLPRRKVAA